MRGEAKGAKAPDSKIHGADMGPTWVLAVPDGPHVGPTNFAIRVFFDETFQCNYLVATASVEYQASFN